MPEEQKTEAAYSYFVSRCGVDPEQMYAARVRSWRILNGVTEAIKGDVAKLGELFWNLHPGGELWDMAVEAYGLHTVSACMLIYRRGPGEFAYRDNADASYIVRVLEDIESEHEAWHE